MAVVKGEIYYKSYVAQLTQTGTNAPVATTLENDIGAIVWTRTGVGDYLGTLASAFTANQTFVVINQGDATGLTFAFWIAARTGANTIRVQTADVTGAASDDLLSDTTIEIRVY